MQDGADMPDPDLEKGFPVIMLTRLDIIKLGAIAEQVSNLTDEDIEAIADQMGLAYTEYGGFWEDLASAVRDRLKERSIPDFHLSTVPVDESSAT